MKNFNKEDNLIEIIFEDDFIIVINKKNGLLSHCNQIEGSISVVSLLKKYGVKLYEAVDSLRDGIVHRLDKDTSGLMVLAKIGVVSDLSTKSVLLILSPFIARYCEVFKFSIELPNNKDGDSLTKSTLV